ncbi:pyruvate, phosphate dikinase [bacterium]|nr:pyruvate, phosphate dikinase [bacterium]MBT3581293.1 pyruvate, phosphate dikinase [bacterium]MBT4552127.1 pyruvate, phosphate dikinase [bacterium]MBT5988133.1 pyruvate, phosphate dikinase [bacterium]MBT7087670.1 pyruvate, phosphate dikinase [bacterium]
MQKKKVYFFGNKKAEGNATMRNDLGGKGANLAEMTNLGIPVPPGFTISTDECNSYYENNQQLSAALLKEIDENLEKVEQSMGLKFGSQDDPLLFSVRSGARVSMPGMMDTVLNLGLNDVSVEGLAKKSGSARFAYDSYRRFIQMFSNVVLDLEHGAFEKILEKTKDSRGVTQDTDLTVEDLKGIVAQYKAYLKDKGIGFPQDPKEQLKLAIGAVFRSWNVDRAIKYRKINKISAEWGTAVNVQAMVFGNMGETSGTGVAFTRDPGTGEKKFFGEFLMNAQGEDVVAGIRTPQPILELKNTMPSAYQELEDIYLKLENHFTDMQDLEFTIQDKKLFLLQTRNGKRTAPAAVKVAVDMVKEGMISKKTALMRVDPEQINQLLHPMIDPKAQVKVIAKGLPASPGAAVGKVVFTAHEAEEWIEKGEKVILVREETSPEDIGGMHVAQGILTARGGMTSHAAVVARGMGKCCVAGCGACDINENTKLLKVGSLEIKEGDYITLNGSKGEVILGQVPLIKAELSGEFGELMQWTDEFRRLKVRTNAETPLDAKVAKTFGAEGIGLCRTEHMFFEGDRIKAVREMILANNETDRRKALDKLLPIQKKDFLELFQVMRGLPVTIRLLDPPLHEFVPHEAEAQQEMAKEMGITVAEVKAKVDKLSEFNPMLGHRGCRLAVTYPEICEMQTRAIIEAAIDASQAGVSVEPEIMVPLVSEVNELSTLRQLIKDVADAVIKEKGVKLNYTIGTMIEIPRAALTADLIAEEADFFSYGTNDLTQMSFGLSRDDSGSFLPEYVEKGILKDDPFQVLDQTGVGRLIEYSFEKARKVKPNLKIGICGEHGGEPSSVEYCHRVGFNYVSCSPYRVPIARLAAAQAVIKETLA